MSTEYLVRIGKRRTIVIPKKLAEKLGLEEGGQVLVKEVNGKIIIYPSADPIWMALHGRKIGRLAPEEVERESVEMQRRMMEDE